MLFIIMCYSYHLFSPFFWHCSSILCYLFLLLKRERKKMNWKMVLKKEKEKERENEKYESDEVMIGIWWCRYQISRRKDDLNNEPKLIGLLIVNGGNWLITISHVIDVILMIFDLNWNDFECLFISSFISHSYLFRSPIDDKWMRNETKQEKQMMIGKDDEKHWWSHDISTFHIFHQMNGKEIKNVRK